MSISLFYEIISDMKYCKMIYETKGAVTPYIFILRGASVMQQLAVILSSILCIYFNYCSLIDWIYALHLCIIHTRGAERKLW